MFVAVITLLGNAVGAVKEFFGFQTKRLELKNTEAVQTSARAQAEVAAVDRVEAAVAKRDVATLREELGE